MTEPTVTAPPTVRPARRRWFQFSLRTLLVVPVVIAILVAWIVAERAQSKKELELASQLQADGATVEFGGPYDDPDVPSQNQPWWRALLNNICGTRVVAFSVTNGTLFGFGWDEEESPQIKLKHVSEFPKLRSLRIVDDKITDLSMIRDLRELRSLELWVYSVADLSPLADLTDLRELFIYSNVILDLRPVSKLKSLQRLNLTSEMLDDLVPLSNLTNLQRLELDGEKIEDLAPLSHLKQLRSLTLVSEYGMMQDVSPLVDLVQLRTMSLYGVRSNNWNVLAKLTNLQELNLRLTQISDIEFMKLKQSLPHCTIDRK